MYVRVCVRASPFAHKPLHGGVEAGEVCQVSCSVALLFSIQDAVSVSWKLIWLASEHQGICLSASQCWGYGIAMPICVFIFM